MTDPLRDKVVEAMAQADYIDTWMRSPSLPAPSRAVAEAEWKAMSPVHREPYLRKASLLLDAALDVLQGESESDIMDFIDALRAGKGSDE